MTATGPFLAGLRTGDLLLALRSAVTLLRARWVLSRRGLPGAMAVFGLEPAPRGERPATEGGAWTSATRREAEIVGRVIMTPAIRGTCLPTAVTLSRVLDGRGVTNDVVIGVSTADGFSAHAWVELTGGRIDLSRHPISAHTEISRLRRTASARG